MNASEHFIGVNVALLVVQATLVRNTNEEVHARILYQFLAEASDMFPRVFPVV